MEFCDFLTVWSMQGSLGAGSLGGRSRPVHHERMWPDILHLVLHYICYRYSRQYRPAPVLAFNSYYQLPHLVLPYVDKFALCSHGPGVATLHLTKLLLTTTKVALTTHQWHSVHSVQAVYVASDIIPLKQCHTCGCLRFHCT